MLDGDDYALLFGCFDARGLEFEVWKESSDLDLVASFHIKRILSSRSKQFRLHIAKFAFA